MQCLRVSELMSLRLDASLPEEQERMLQEHLAGCEVCQQEWKMLQRVSDLFENAPPAVPPPLLVDRVMVRVRQRERRMQWLRGGILGLLALVILASLCLAPLMGLSSLAVSVLNRPSTISTIVGAVVRLVDVSHTLLRALALAAQALLSGTNWLFLIAYLGLATLLALGWMRVVLRPVALKVPASSLGHS